MRLGDRLRLRGFPAASHLARLAAIAILLRPRIPTRFCATSPSILARLATLPTSFGTVHIGAALLRAPLAAIPFATIPVLLTTRLAPALLPRTSFTTIARIAKIVPAAVVTTFFAAAGFPGTALILRAPVVPATASLAALIPLALLPLATRLVPATLFGAGIARAIVLATTALAAIIAATFLRIASPVTALLTAGLFLPSTVVALRHRCSTFTRLLLILLLSGLSFLAPSVATTSATAPALAATLALCLLAPLGAFLSADPELLVLVEFLIMVIGGRGDLLGACLATGRAVVTAVVPSFVTFPVVAVAAVSFGSLDPGGGGHAIGVRLRCAWLPGSPAIAALVVSTAVVATTVTSLAIITAAGACIGSGRLGGLIGA